MDKYILEKIDSIMISKTEQDILVCLFRNPFFNFPKNNYVYIALRKLERLEYIIIDKRDREHIIYLTTSGFELAKRLNHYESKKNISIKKITINKKTDTI